MFLNFQTSKPEGRPKSKLLVSSQPDRWFQDVKTFEFEVFGPKNLRRFQHPGVMPLDAKSFDFNVFRSSNLQTGDHLKSKLLAVNIVDGPRVVKPSNSRFGDPANLEFERFNILGSCRWMLKVWICMFLNFQTSKLGGHPKSKLLKFSQPRRWPQDVKTFEFDVF